MIFRPAALFLLAVAAPFVESFAPHSWPRLLDCRLSTNTRLCADIVSPFADREEEEEPDDGGYLELTWENVDKVLDEMRPYLIQDGGNVVIQDIEGPVVRLELQVRTKLREQEAIEQRGRGELINSFCVRRVHLLSV